MVKLVKPVYLISLLILQVCSQISIELFIPGGERRCLAEVFHPKESVAIEYKLVNEDADAKLEFQINNSRDEEIYRSTKNSDTVMHKITDKDKVLNICVDNKGHGDGSQRVVKFLVKNSVHINDFSAVATTVRILSCKNIIERY